MCVHLSFFFFFNDPPTTEIYTLSLHDALPIWWLGSSSKESWCSRERFRSRLRSLRKPSCLRRQLRSEEHTSELQSLRHLVCRLLLEKKKKNITIHLDATNK